MRYEERKSFTLLVRYTFSLPNEFHE